jgi:hypothetical protein
VEIKKMTILDHGNNISTKDRAERTPGAAAVSQVGRGGRDIANSVNLGGTLGDFPATCLTNSSFSSLPSSYPSSSTPSLPSPTDKPRSKKVRRLARRWAWMKGDGRYLDYITYYKGEAGTDKLKHCHEWWHRERHKETSDVRLRATGCGDTHICPLCASYKQLKLAGQAFDEMMLAQEALEVDQVVLPSYGLKLVLTLPKDMSSELDRDLFEGYERWQRNLNALYKEISSLVRRWFGLGCGFVIGLDVTGESNPTEGHYHFNIYIFPARRVGKEWLSLPKWIPKDGKGLTLRVMRKSWADAVKGIFPHKLSELDVNVGFLAGSGALRNWLEYQYRPVLADLWRGWRDFDGEQIKYEYRKPNRESDSLQISLDDGLKALNRVNLIPTHFKRIRWCGIFSDGQRSKTMQGLGLGREQQQCEYCGYRWNADKLTKKCPSCQEALTQEEEEWERFGEMLTFCYYTKNGVVLREEDGSEIEFPDGVVHYGPSGVTMGKRTRWRAPGTY